MVKKKVIKEIKKDSSEVFGITGFILGILSILFLELTGVFLSVLGGIFCLIQNKKQKTKFSKIGLILNIIGFVLNIAWILIYYFIVYPYLASIGYSI